MQVIGVQKENRGHWWRDDDTDKCCCTCYDWSSSVNIFVITVFKYRKINKNNFGLKKLLLPLFIVIILGKFINIYEFKFPILEND